MHVLVVEDDNDINGLLCNILAKEGYETLSAFSGTEARLLLKSETVDFILMDYMLPGVDGSALTEEIRKTSSVPIIAISAKTDRETKLEFFRHGVDDYIAKPFDNEEVLLRIEAVLRRTGKGGENVAFYAHKDIRLNDDDYTVISETGSVQLTLVEYRLMRLLMEHPKKVFTKQNLIQSVWNDDFVDDNTVNVHVSNLRQKLGEISSEKHIKTVWGIGYKLED